MRVRKERRREQVIPAVEAKGARAADAGVIIVRSKLFRASPPFTLTLRQQPPPAADVADNVCRFAAAASPLNPVSGVESVARQSERARMREERKRKREKTSNEGYVMMEQANESHLMTFAVGCLSQTEAAREYTLSCSECMRTCESEGLLTASAILDLHLRTRFIHLSAHTQ